MVGYFIEERRFGNLAVIVSEEQRAPLDEDRQRFES